MVGGDPVMARGYTSALQLLSEHPEVTAVFCYNDLLALGAIQACQELDLKVPDDCAIVGFDDIQFAALVKPALTTVRVDKVKLGRKALNLLVDMLNAPESIPEPVYVDVELVMRESA
jgi:LacI family transcriptional regulator